MSRKKERKKESKDDDIVDYTIAFSTQSLTVSFIVPAIRFVGLDSLLRKSYRPLRLVYSLMTVECHRWVAWVEFRVWAWVWEV